MQENVPKITIKKICQKVSKPETPTPLMTVIGVVNKYRYAQSDSGVFPVFSGNFYAKNISTEKTYKSSKAVFPPALSKLLVDALTVYKNSEGLQIAATLNAEPADNLAGLEFTVGLLGDIVPYDPVSALVDRFEGKPPQASKHNGSRTDKPRTVKTNTPTAKAKPKNTARRAAPVASHAGKQTASQRLRKH
jgi:hypothetical protein